MVKVTIDRMEASASAESIAFKAAFGDGASLTGSCSVDGTFVVHGTCCARGGFAGGPGRASGAHAVMASFPDLDEDGPCPHVLRAKTPLAKLAREAGWSAERVRDTIASADPRPLPGSPLDLGRLEWSYADGKWSRGLARLAFRPIFFPRRPELEARGLYAEPDPGFMRDPKLWKRLDAIAADEFTAVLLVGPSGVGKSTKALQWCADRGRPVVHETIGANKSVGLVLGEIGLEDGSTVVRDGIARILSEPGGTLVLDEITAAVQREWTPLWDVLQRGTRVFRCVIDGRQVEVPVHPTAMIVATANERKAIHAEANGGHGFAQLRRFTVVRLTLSAGEVMAVARRICANRLAPATVDLGGGASWERPDRSDLLDLLDFDRIGAVVEALMVDPVVSDVIEVSPEIVACALLDAASPDVGPAEALLSHFVLKAELLADQEAVAAAIAATGVFPELA